MSRVIKFRAWDKIEKQIIIPSYVFNDERETDYILMQYTGLKDKNDKEIYEGDIITITYSNGEKIKKYAVKYCDDCGYYMLKSIDRKYDLDTFCGYGKEQIEIIGNIYENPELLKE